MFFCPVDIFSADLPVIFYTDVTNGPGTGGENNQGCYLSIFGKNFGASQGSSSVTIGGGEAAAYKFWSDTRVSIQIGSNAATGSIVLTTSAGTVTGPDAFTVRSGNIYFVSYNGSDTTGNGSFSSPYRTPNKVFGSLPAGVGSAGDFLYIRGGTYDLDAGTERLQQNSWLNASISGSSGNHCVFSAYPGETVTIKLDSSSYYAWSQTTGTDLVSYWVVADFHTDITSSTGMPWRFGWVSDDTRKVSYFRVINLDIQGGGNSETDATPFETGRMAESKLLGIRVHDSARTGPSNTPFISMGGEEITDTEIGWCTIEDCTFGSAALQIQCDGTGKDIDNITIHDCIIHDVPDQAILTGSNTKDITFYNNIIYNTNLSLTADNAVISCRGNGGSNPAFYNNTIYASSGTGIFELSNVRLSFCIRL